MAGTAIGLRAAEKRSMAAATSLCAHWVARHQLMAAAARNLHGEMGASYAGGETVSFSAAVTTARLGEGRKTVKQVPLPPPFSPAAFSKFNLALNYGITLHRRLLALAFQGVWRRRWPAPLLPRCSIGDESQDGPLLSTLQTDVAARRAVSVALGCREPGPHCYSSGFFDEGGNGTPLKGSKSRGQSRFFRTTARGGQDLACVTGS